MLNVTSNGSVLTFSRGSSYSLALVGFLYFLGTVVILINIPSAIIMIVSFFKRTETKTIHVLLSLSITDMLFGFLWFLIIDTNIDTVNISYTECFVRFYFTGIAYFVSNVHVFIISLDRVCTVCLNLKLFTNHRRAIAIATVAGSWIFSAVSLGLIQTLNGRDSGEHECSLSRVIPKGSFPAIPFLLTLIHFGTLCNFLIMVTFLIRHQHQMKPVTRSEISKSDIRLCITVGLISIVCTLLNVPWTVLLFRGTLGIWPSRLFRNCIFILSSLTAIINPIVYIYRTRKFKTLLVEGIQSFYCYSKYIIDR